MGQYNRYKHVEQRHYNQQLKLLYKIFTRKGYTHIKFIDTRKSALDLKEGVDVIMIAEYNGIIQDLPIALRSREDCNFRDITIRYKVNFGKVRTEYDKIMDESCHAKLILYTWHLSRVPEYLQFALVSVKQIKTVLPLYTKDKHIITNIKPDGTRDGSKAICIPAKDLILLASNI